MAKKLIIVIILFILTFTGFMLTGCNNSLSVGFDGVRGDPAPSDYCAYSSDVSEFNINNVTLEFYYGGIFSEDIEYERSHGKNIGKIKLYFQNPAISEFFILDPVTYENLYFIKESDEDYTSETHRWKGNLYEAGEGDIITIPKDLFVNERGVIGFYVFGKDKNQIDYPNNEYKCVSGINIYYKVNGDRVKLSGEEI